MGIRSVLKTGIGRTGPTGLQEMRERCDCAGLVEALRRVSYENVPIVLAYLTELSEQGYHDRIISYGAIPLASYMMHCGPLNQRKNAAFLISSFVIQGRSDIVMVNDGIVDGFANLLKEDDRDLARCITYGLSVFLTMGGASIFVNANGIEGLLDHLRREDEMTVYYGLLVLKELLDLGYFEYMLEHEVYKCMEYHHNGHPGIQRLSMSILDELYGWEENDFILREEELDMIPDNIERIGIDDGYIRPERRSTKPSSKEVKVLNSNGGRVRHPGDDDKEVLVELKKKDEEGVKSGSLDEISSIPGMDMFDDFDKGRSSEPVHKQDFRESFF